MNFHSQKLSQPYPQKIQYDNYDSLKDFIESSQNKKKIDTQKDSHGDQQQDKLQFDMNSIKKYMEVCQQNNLKGIPLQERSRIITQLSILPSDGFNVLIYGYGSKQILLQEIGNQISRKFPCYAVFSIKGFNPTFKMKQMCIALGELIKKYLPEKINQEGNNNKFSFLDGFTNTELQIVILIHSIDGKYLMNNTFYQFLKKISVMSGIKIVASFDSYHYPEMNIIKNAYYSKVNTFTPYTNELNTMLVQQLGIHKQEEGLEYIFKSLNSNQKELIQLLARILIKKKLPEKGPSINQFFQKCVNKAILSNKQQLKENLQELVEQNVVQLKKDHYTMPYPQQSLEILAQGFTDKQIKEEHFN